MIFLGQDGNKTLKGLSDGFSNYFDWELIPVGGSLYIKKNKEIPATIYLKTDFLPIFQTSILPKINNPFILITGASDYSPQINFLSVYNQLIKDPRLIFWFMNNMRFKNSKSFSLPAGLGARRLSNELIPNKVDSLIMKIRKETNYKNKISDKIFVGFKSRKHNDCGKDMVIRPALYKIAKENPDIFDVYDNMPADIFIKTLSKYKYSLCPHGNGLDPNPTAWISLSVYTIPVMYRTDNVEDMFSGKEENIILFDQLENISNNNLYKDKEPIEFEFLTSEYWANKIKSKI